jgi:Dirigent-like protein
VPPARVHRPAAAVVGERDLDGVIGVADLHVDAARVRVLERVRQPLLDDPVEGEVRARAQRGGSLMFYGLLHGPRSTLAVIGGTGRYRHARGTLTLRTLDEHRTRWTFALAR